MVERFFRLVERLGNRLPHPAVLFLYLCIFVLVLSFVAGAVGWSAVNPVDGELIVAKSLLNEQGLIKFLQHMVTNFTHFAPLGLVVVMLMGVSVSEKSGFLEAFIRTVINKVPSLVVIPVIVVAAACGNIGSDAGIIIVPPIAAVIFKSLGLHPLAGLVLGYASATAGFTANLIPAGTDVLLSGITTEVYQTIEPGRTVVATSNWYFIAAATFFLAIVGTFVVRKFTIPACQRFPVIDDGRDHDKPLSPREKRALVWSLAAAALYVGLVALTIVPENGILRAPPTESFMTSPFFKSLIPILFFLFLIIGWIYGKMAGTIRKTCDAAHFMIEGVRSLAPYIVLVFMIAQFITFFRWSNIDQLIAINGAEFLKALDISGIPLFLGFVLLTALINLFIGSSSAKWAMMAPVFITMFYHLGLSPAFTQLLYRVGDSVTNGISPLYTMFPLMLGWIEQYDEEAGIGTITSLLLPYALFTLIAWFVLLVAWYLIGLPIGLGEPIR